MEIILGKARRRWSDEEKRALVAQTFEPGGSVSGVARRHGVSASMLFIWRKQFRAALGFSKQPDGVGFAAVAIAGPDAGVPVAVASPTSDARISVEFGCGARMTVTGAVDPMLAAAVVKALALAQR